MVFGTAVGCVRNTQNAQTVDPLIAYKKAAADTKPESVYVRKAAEHLVIIELQVRSLDALMVIARRRYKNQDYGQLTSADSVEIRKQTDALRKIDEQFYFAGHCYDYYRLSLGPGNGNNAYADVFLTAYQMCCEKLSKNPDREAGAALKLLTLEHDLGRHDLEDIQDLIAEQEKLAKRNAKTTLH